jgi:hypothetical protein
MVSRRVKAAMGNPESQREVRMTRNSDTMGGPESDEEGSDVLGGPEQGPGDELGGPEPDEEGTDVLGGGGRS